MRKQCIHFFSAVLDLILFILAGNDNIHESSDGFEICLDLTRSDTNRAVQPQKMARGMIFRI